MELGPHCLSLEKPSVCEKALQYSMNPRTDHLVLSSILQCKRQTHRESLQLLSVPVPIVDAVPCSTAPTLVLVLKVSRSIFKHEINGSFANTYRLHIQSTRLCLQQVIFFKNRPILSLWVWMEFFFGLFVEVFLTYMWISRSSGMYCIWPSDLRREWWGHEALNKKQTNSLWGVFHSSWNVIFSSISTSKDTRTKIHIMYFNDISDPGFISETMSI